MTLAQLRYFCTACHYQSITRAAEVLFVSQPAISSAIRALEKEYQLQLLVRKSKNFELTEDGETFCRHAELLLRQAEHFSRQMQDLAQRVATVSVGITRTTSISLYTDFFSYYLTQRTAININTVFSFSRQLVEEVKNGSLDLAFVSDEAIQQEDGLEKRILKNIPFGYIVSENHPLAKEPFVTVSMIGDEPMVSTVHDNIKHADITRTFAACGKTPRVIQRFDQLSAVINTVQSGAANAYLPLDQVRNYKGIVYLPLKEGRIVPYSLIWSKSSACKPAVRQLMELIFLYFSTQNQEAAEKLPPE